MVEVKTRGVKVRNAFVLAGTILAVFVPVWFAAAALGTKFGLWDWQVGLVRMVGAIGVPLLGLLVLMTIVTSLVVVIVKPRAGFGVLAVMWVVSLGAAGIALSAIRQASGVPPIHDISTDTRAPLTFSSRVMTERGAGSNKVLPPNEASVPFNRNRLNQWSGRTLVEIQDDAFPSIKPAIIEGQTPAAIFAKASSSAKALGYKNIVEDAGAMRIEGYAQSFWFGFKDDVVIQVTPIANGARVDMRSVSRVGISDLGANAKRVEAFMDKMKS